MDYLALSVEIWPVGLNFKSRKKQLKWNLKIYVELSTNTNYKYYFIPAAAIDDTGKVGDDEQNWKEVFKVMNASRMIKTDDGNIDLFETILRVNARERGELSSVVKILRIAIDLNIYMLEENVKMYVITYSSCNENEFVLSR